LCNFRVREFLDIPQPDRVAKNIRQPIEGGPKIRVERTPQQQLLGSFTSLPIAGRRLSLFETGAVDLDSGRLPSGISKAIPPRIVENRREPRSQIRAALEPVLEAQRFDERILHQVFGIGPVPGQPQRRREERLEVT
jgi:hypothetical protein